MRHVQISGICTRPVIAESRDGSTCLGSQRFYEILAWPVRRFTIEEVLCSVSECNVGRMIDLGTPLTS